MSDEPRTDEVAFTPLVVVKPDGTIEVDWYDSIIEGDASDADHRSAALLLDHLLGFDRPRSQCPSPACQLRRLADWMDGRGAR